MKIVTSISFIALILSVIALAISVNQFQQQLTQDELDGLVDAALERKEREYVQSLAPSVNALYQDMLAPYQPPEKEPETFQELFAPAIEIITNLTH